MVGPGAHTFLTSTSTSLNLRAVLKTAATRSGMEVPAREVSGLTPPAKALFVAAAAHAHPQAVVLYVVPSDADLEQTVADVSFFVAAVEGLSAGAAEHAVLPFPSHEVDPYRGLAPHVGVTSARARALHAIARGTARVVVASAAALLPRVSAPDRLLAASLELKPGQDIAPTDLAELLVDAGLTREDPADEHGEFAVRGGIVDIFPASETHPVRLEFIGDTIETLRTYDPATQRSIAAIDQVAIVPLKDVLSEDRRSTLFDYLSRAKETHIIVSERDEVDAQATKQLEQMQRSFEEKKTAAPQLPPPGLLFADWNVVDATLATATNLSYLGLSDDAAEPAAKDLKALPARHVRCQPTAEMRGRVADWVADIRRQRDEGGVTLFVAATQGRADRTIELLKEYDVFAIPVERAEDARYAAVLVAIGGL